MNFQVCALRRKGLYRMSTAKKIMKTHSNALILISYPYPYNIQWKKFPALDYGIVLQICYKTKYVFSLVRHLHRKNSFQMLGHFFRISLFLFNSIHLFSIVSSAQLKQANAKNISSTYVRCALCCVNVEHVVEIDTQWIHKHFKWTKHF